MSAKQNLESIQKQLQEALAQRALIDEKILSLRNVMQGAGLGVELEKEAQAESAKAAASNAE